MSDMYDTAEKTSDEQVHSRRKARTAAGAAVFACAMLGLAFASVPLYQLFCQVTGFAGTTQRATEASSKVLDQSITVRFDSNVSSGLSWAFKPVQNTVDIKIGENTLAFYRATNTSDKPLTGTATFNVAPEAAGGYFNKMECFCFTEQTLQPGESVEMPVSFFIDPEMLKDRSARSISQITLSYTFFPVKNKNAASVTPDAAIINRKNGTTG